VYIGTFKAINGSMKHSKVLLSQISVILRFNNNSSEVLKGIIEI